MNVSDFRNVAFSQGNVKIKTDGDQQQVVASNGFKGRAVTWLKNAMGARREKNLETLHAFEQALHKDGSFDHDEVTNVMQSMRDLTKNGRKTLSADNVKFVLGNLKDQQTLERISSGHKQQMVANVDKNIAPLLKAEGQAIEQKANTLVDTLKNLTEWDESLATASGALRDMTTGIAGTKIIFARVPQLEQAVGEDVKTLNELYNQEVAGAPFSQWGTPGTFASVGKEFEEVRSDLLEHAEKMQPIAQRLNAAVQAVTQ